MTPTRAILLGLAVTCMRGAVARAQGQLPEWTLADAPSAMIGGDGSPTTEFFRVARAWRLSGNRIAVANGATGEIRIFAARGRYLRTFGRNGSGPGEFRQFGSISRAGDSAFIYDGNLRRISMILLDERPRLVSELPVTIADERGFDVVGRVADGRWLVHAMLRPDVNARGVQRIPGLVGVVGANATGRVDLLTEMPDLSVFVHSTSAAAKLVSITETAFPSAFDAVASASVLWLGDEATDTLVRIDATSGARRTIRLPDPPAPLTRAIVDAARAREMAAARDDAARSVVALMYGEEYLPKRLPGFQALVAGPGGEVWVLRATERRVGPAQYVVISANGVAMARVKAPAGFRVTDVGRDYVVGVHRDGDGVETVREYEVKRRR